MVSKLSLGLKTVCTASIAIVQESPRWQLTADRRLLLTNYLKDPELLLKNTMSAYDVFVHIASASREGALLQSTRNKYTIGFPPVRGDNPRALAKHGVTIYTTYISVDLAHHELLHA